MWCESSQWIFGSSYLSEASSGLWFRHVQFLATVLFFQGFFFLLIVLIELSLNWGEGFFCGIFLSV